MPQSIAVIPLHLTFSTRQRAPYLIESERRQRVHAYMGGLSRHRGHLPIVIGGVADHVHILARFGREGRISDWVRDLKFRSTQKIHTTWPDLRDFAWQRGYAVFAVGRDGILPVRRYIENQEDHHANVSYQEELRRLLAEHNEQVDETYLWD